LGRNLGAVNADPWDPARSRQGSLFAASEVCLPDDLELQVATKRDEAPVSRVLFDPGPAKDIRSIVALKDSFLAICGELCDILSANQYMRTDGVRSKSESSGERCTVGIMLCGTKVQNTLIGGPSAGLLEKGDILLRIDGEPVTEDDVVAKLKGCDIPGSQILITVGRRGSTSPNSKIPSDADEGGVVNEIDILVTRMATSDIADRRRMFDLFTILEVCNNFLPPAVRIEVKRIFSFILG
jgi:hypothetical protein